jgi:CRP-like cAMP-binding protein
MPLMSTAPTPRARAYAQPGQNRLLELLTETDQQLVLTHAELTSFAYNDTLVRPRRPITQVIFPTSFVGCAVTTMLDGSSIETGTIGNEGLIGLSLLFGVQSAPTETMCQIPGEGLCLPSQLFQAIVNERSALRTVLLRYTQYVLVQSGQSIACNRLHTVRQRYARWVLMAHDRVGHNHFPLTREFLAMMLGVRVASVSAAASDLRAAGVVHYSRGTVTVTDRAGLEAAACECYRVTRDEYDRLFGVTDRSGT